MDPLSDRGRAGVPTDVPPSHLSLLERSRMLQRTAMHSDADAVLKELIDLRLALTVHVLAEQPDVNQLASSANAAVVRGQQDLLRLVDRLIAARGKGGHHVLRSIVDLTRRLRRQARIEAGLLGRPESSVTPDDRHRRDAT
jgi:hypothetical protein